MHRTTSTTVLGLLAAVLIALAGCASGGSDPDAGSSSDESSAPGSQGPKPDLTGIPDVVAEVNGEELTRDDFVPIYEAQFQQAAIQSQATGQAPDEDALKKQTADGLVDSELLRQEADGRGIRASAQDVENTLTELAKANQLGSAQEFLDAIEQQGTSEEEARDQVETQVLVEGLVTDEVGAIQPTESELRALYEQTKQQQAAQGQQGGQPGGQPGAQQPIPPFEQVRPQLEQQAVAQEQGKVAQQLVGELRKGAEVTLNL